MAIEVALIVLDVPPLTTLAAAERLDYLLYPELPVIIPDAVFYEATRQIDRLGAQEILAWHRDRQEKIRIEPTIQKRGRAADGAGGSYDKGPR